MTKAYHSFAEWLESGQGDYLQQREQAWFDWKVADLFGFNAVQIGLPQLNLLRASRIARRYRLDSVAQADVLANPLHLPFASQSLDLLVLPHALEFSVSPHQILREAERVLIAEGNLLLSGFNPYSLWGLYHWYKQRRGKFLWPGDFVTLRRLRDWLTLLGCELEAQRLCCYVPPLAHRRWVPWFECLEMAGENGWMVGGGVYFVHAVKRVHGMRLIAPGWSDKPALGRVLRPASRAMQNESQDGI